MLTDEELLRAIDTGTLWLKLKKLRALDYIKGRMPPLLEVTDDGRAYYMSHPKPPKETKSEKVKFDLDRAVSRFRSLLAWRAAMSPQRGEDLVALIVSFTDQDEIDPRLRDNHGLTALWLALKKFNKKERTKIVRQYAAEAGKLEP